MFIFSLSFLTKCSSSPRSLERNSTITRGKFGARLPTIIKTGRYKKISTKYAIFTTIHHFEWLIFVVSFTV